MTRRSRARHTPRTRSLFGIVLLVLAALSPIVAATGAARADSTTGSSDTLRTGWYPDQTALTPALVSGGSFGKLFTTNVNGQVYAQPLVSNGTVFVATETNNIYGLDPVTGAQQWTRNVGTPWNPADIGCADLTPSIGVTGTPVIDPATQIAYFVSKSYASGASGPAAYFMHAIAVATGVEQPGFPVAIQGTAANNPSRTFPATTQMQRPGLLLMNGVVYAGFGAHCDHSPWAGWIAAVTTGGQLKTMWTTIGTSNLGGAGIWSPGGGLVSDGAGRIFFSTGNGAVSSTLTHPIPGNTPPIDLGQSVVRVDLQNDGTLKANDFFAPFDAIPLDQNDQDLGASNPVALPAQFGAGTSTPHLLVADGKEGIVYLLNRDSLGGYQQGPSGGDASVARVGPNGGVWGRPGVWPGDGGYIYYVTSTGGTGSLNGFMRMYKYGVDGSNHPTLSLVASSTDAFGFGSGSPIVTSNGTGSGTALVWVIWSANGQGTNAQLRAYDPTPVNGQFNLRFSAPIGTSSKFSTPGVGANRLYVGTRDGTVIGFGSPVTAPASAPPLNFPNTVIGQNSALNATFTANSNITVTGFQSNNSVFVTGTPSRILPAAMTAGQTITVPVTFTPTTTGLTSGNLTLTTQSSGSAVTGMTGTGESAAAQLQAQPTFLSLNGVPVGGSATGSVTFTNIGAQPLTVQSVTAPGAPFHAIGLPTVNSVIPGNSSVTASVTFSPTAPGNFADNVVIASTAGTVTVPLTGTSGAPPGMTIAPLSVPIGEVPVGNTSTGSFTITNTGGTPLTITKSKPPALNIGFTAVTNLPEGSTIPAGGSVTETVSFAATAAGPFSDSWIITGNDGSGQQTVTFKALAVPAAAIPSPVAGGWTLNGDAALTPPALVLTPPVISSAGSAFWPAALPSSYVRASFDANIDSGTGADGLTLTFADPTQGATPTAIGTHGGGLGFSGIPGVAVALDTFQNAGNPAPNFVGITDGGTTPGSDIMHWLATNATVPSLRNATIHVDVTLANGVLNVKVNGIQALSQAVTVSPQVLVGFTAGNGGLTDRHAVSNVAITTVVPSFTSNYTTDEVAQVDFVAQHFQTDRSGAQRTGAAFLAFLAALVQGQHGTEPTLGSAPGSGPVAVTTLYNAGDNATVLQASAQLSSDPWTVQRSGVLLLAYLLRLSGA